jgi:cobalt-zinc-cadmium efflux system outer membrane protein
MAPLAKGQGSNSMPTIPSLTLEELVTEALGRNPELKFYEAELSAARAGGKTTGLIANPEVSGDVGQKRLSGGGLSDEGIAWSVSVMQPFEWPGRLGLRKAIANRDIELAELGYNRFKIALTARVRMLAYGLFAAQEKSAAAGEVADRFKSLREVLVQRDPAGLTPLLETRVIEATELNSQRKASESLLAAQSALLELNQLRGVMPDTQFSVRTTELAFRPAELRDTLLALARTNNFEVRMRAAELAQQGFRVKLAKNERYPALAIGPTYSDEKVGNDREQIVGVGVSFPLPFWNRNSGNIEIAKARQMQAEISLNLTEREIQRQVLAAALGYETKLREMAKWRPDSVQHFKEAAELADRHYRLGAVPISTYVELQQQYLDAVDGLLDTKREALEAAAKLELLTGLSQPLTQPVRPASKELP